MATTEDTTDAILPDTSALEAEVKELQEKVKSLDQENLELRETATDLAKDLSDAKAALKVKPAAASGGFPPELAGKPVLFVGLVKDVSDQFRRHELADDDLALVVKG